MWTKPDGEIEIANSSCGCPPDADTSTGMHVNRGTTWYRVDDDEWRQIEPGSAIDACELAKAARTCEEFREAMST